MERYVNMLASWGAVFANGVPACVSDFLSAQDEYARAQVAVQAAAPCVFTDRDLVRQVAANPGDPWWAMLGVILSQFDGLVQGYGNSSSPPLPLFAFQVSVALSLLQKKKKKKKKIK